MVAFSRLVITDGTFYESGQRREVNLLCIGTGFCLTEWRPRATEPKGGGVWSDSALAAGRRLHVAQPANVTETYALEIHDYDADELIIQTRTLRQLLEKARAYWTTSWATEPVWIEAQGVHESEMRYSLIADYRTPQDGDPYGQPFWQKVEHAGMSEFELAIEREPFWRDCEPGDSECLEISAAQQYCASYPLDFEDLTTEGQNTYVYLGSPAALDNLPSADFTLDGWIYVRSSAAPGHGKIFDKYGLASGWYAGVTDTLALYATATYDVTMAESGTAAASVPIEEWIHVAFVWDQSSDEFAIYINGVDETSSQIAGADSYQVDAARDAYIGGNLMPDEGFDGQIGWLRLSDTVRWSADFTPPVQCILPSVDANTVWLGIREGTGTTVYDLTANSNDGSISGATWGACCQIYAGNYLPCSPQYMTFNGASSTVNCGSDASLDNLPSADFTIEAWVYATGWGGLNFGMIAGKTSWAFNISNLTGIEAWADFNITPAVSAGTLTDFSLNEWHHVTATWELAALTWRLWVDGIEVTYTSQVAGNAVYAGDAAASLLLGEYIGGSQWWDGHIGWIRLSDSLRYTDDFEDAIPPRCTIPTYDANTISVWNVVDPNLLVADLYGVNEGTPTDLMAGCDCITAGVEETCDADTAFITNHHKQAQLNHLLYYDNSAATYSPNLLTQVLPYPILPNVPAANDVFYAGIDTGLPDTGPFSSLVFDLATAGDDLSFSNTGGSYWQYWNGAWTWLNEQDNTNADGAGTGETFDTEGVRSIHWAQPGDWSVTTINGITGYWVRCILAGVGAAPVPPVQDNRHPYTISWPYIEVDADNVGGDVAALIRQHIRNQSDKGGTVSDNDLYSTRVLVGLRSLSRGADFTPFINWSNEQNNAGLTITLGGSSAWRADSASPTGIVIRTTNAIAAGSLAATATFASGLAQQYQGIFHAFLRGHQLSGSAGDILVELQGAQNIVGYSPETVLSDRVSFPSTNDWELVDLGRLALPMAGLPDIDEIGNMYLGIMLYGNSSVDVDSYELILFPVDEWAIDTQDLNPGAISDFVRLGRRDEPDGITVFGYIATSNTYLDINGATGPRAPLRSLLKYYPNDLMWANYVAVSPGPSIAQRGVDQRYWFLHTSDRAYSRPEISNSLQSWRVQRYISMRGNS